MDLDLPVKAGTPGRVRRWKTDGHKELQAEANLGHGNSHPWNFVVRAEEGWKGWGFAPLGFI